MNDETTKSTNDDVTIEFLNTHLICSNVRFRSSSIIETNEMQRARIENDLCICMYCRQRRRNDYYNERRAFAQRVENEMRENARIDRDARRTRKNTK